jgi:molybdate transport system ATP-binding protein
MAVAGLLKPDSCRIDIDGTVLADAKANVWCSPGSRLIGLVFQDARLFPHMSVLRNLNFGARRAPSGPIRFDDVVNLLGIEHLLNRRPYSLSGGERQRVAIGCVLLAQLALLAMDEPLASLDAPRKAEILPFLALSQGRKQARCDPAKKYAPSGHVADARARRPSLRRSRLLGKLEPRHPR